MKIFLPVLAAIICAAALIIGYLHFDSNYSEWKRAKGKAVVDYQLEKRSLSRLQVSIGNGEFSQETVSDVLPVARKKLADDAYEVVKILEAKPVIPLTSEETAVRDEARTTLQNYNAAP